MDDRVENLHFAWYNIDDLFIAEDEMTALLNTMLFNEETKFAPSEISGTIAKLLIIVSVLAFLFAFIWLFKRKALFKRKNGRAVSFEERGVYFILLLLLSTILVRFAAARAGAFSSLEDRTPVFDAFKELVNSIIYSLQSFTMDADYLGFLVNGSRAFRDLLGDFWARSFELYVSILSSVCAVSGGAVLLTIIIKLFPGILLWIASHFCSRPNYYFSKLNPESLALAKSIYEGEYHRKEGSGPRPRLIFCDADTEEDKVSSENAAKARRLKAHLIKTSLSDIDIDKKKQKKMFLIGTDEENLAALSSFASENRLDSLNEKDAIYVFANENYGTLVESSVRSRINAALKERNKDSAGITLFSVNRYRSIVYNLFRTIPLYTSLGDDDHIRIAIFGSGLIGTELFLAAYWCGQMLDRKLVITVVSNEKKEYFEGSIDHVNEQILKPTKLTGGRTGSDDSYLDYEYIQSDVYVEGLEDILTAEAAPPAAIEEQSKSKSKSKSKRKNGKLADFDYFAVALGTDKKNLEVAEQIARIVTVKGKPRSKPVPVVCSVWDGELSKTLPRSEAGSFAGAEVLLFGTLEESFDYKNVLLENIKSQVISASSAYERNYAEKMSKANGEKYGKDPYSFWSNVAKAIHAGYKAHSLRLTKKKAGQPADDETAKSFYFAMCEYLKCASEIRSALLSLESYTAKAWGELSIDSLGDGAKKKLQAEVDAMKTRLESKPSTLDPREVSHLARRAEKLKITLDKYVELMLAAVDAFNNGAKLSDRITVSAKVSDQDGIATVFDLLCVDSEVKNLLTDLSNYTDDALKDALASFTVQNLHNGDGGSSKIAGEIAGKLERANAARTTIAEHLEKHELRISVAGDGKSCQNDALIDYTNEFGIILTEAQKVCDYLKESAAKTDDEMSAPAGGTESNGSDNADTAEGTVAPVEGTTAKPDENMADQDKHVKNLLTLHAFSPTRPDFIHRLAWLEHRRWNAFMQTEGFSAPSLDEEKAYIDRLPDDPMHLGINSGMHKSVQLKLHPCIVECNDEGMHSDLFELNEEKVKALDPLDNVSHHFYVSYAEKSLGTYNFKMYDYPEYE